MLVEWSVTRKMPPTRLGGGIMVRQSIPNRRTMLRGRLATLPLLIMRA